MAGKLYLLDIHSSLRWCVLCFAINTKTPINHLSAVLSFVPLLLHDFCHLQLRSFKILLLSVTQNAI